MSDSEDHKTTPIEDSQTPGANDQQSTTAVVGELTKAAIQTPQGKKAAGNVGDCAVIVTETAKNCLLPLVAINKGFDKAKEYFNERFNKDLEEKLEDVAPEDIVEPKPSIAGPAMQGLAYSHEEKNLKDMYISLLANSMNRHTESSAHPAFVEVVKQLSSGEAQILKFILKSENNLLAICEATQANKKGERALKRYVMPFFKKGEYTKQPASFETMVDNFVRLGLVHIDFTRKLLGENIYEWIDFSPDILDMREIVKTTSSELRTNKGYMGTTSFGYSFARAVGIC